MVKPLLFRLDKSQRKEFGKYWFDVSKIMFASLVVKLFEPGAPVIILGSLVTILFGLTSSVFFAILGLRFSKEERR